MTTTLYFATCNTCPVDTDGTQVLPDVPRPVRYPFATLEERDAWRADHATTYPTHTTVSDGQEDTFTG